MQKEGKWMNVQQKRIIAYSEIWGTYALKKKPVYLLKKCLESYNERTRTAISHTIKIEGKRERESQEAWIDRLAVAVQQDMKQQLAYLTDKQADFLLSGVENTDTSPIADIDDLVTALSLLKVGWGYWFFSNEEIHFVIPEELKKIVREAIVEGNFFLQQQKYPALSEYIEALVNLYGAFEINHLLAVWNQHHPEELLTLLQLTEFITGINEHQFVFENEGNLIYAAGAIDAEIAESMVLNLALVPYYVPKPEEIEALAHKEPSVHFRSLEKYIRKSIHQPEYLLQAISDNLCIGFLPEKGIEELVLAGLVDKDNAEFMNNLRFLYDRVFNDTRNWIIRGHTPNELKQMYAPEADEIPF